MAEPSQPERLSRVLLVDDDPSQLRTLAAIVEAEGFDVVGAATAGEALEHLRGGGIHAAVVDLRLPDMTDTELLENLHEFSGQVDVIIHTGFSSYESARDAVNVGAFAYVEKGGRPDALLRHIHRAVATRLARYTRGLENAVAERTRELQAAIERLGEEVEERRRAEEAIKESEERYRGLFEGAAEGILVADSGTKQFLYANRALCAMLGYSEEEVTRMRVHDLHPPERLEHVLSKFEAQTRGENRLVTSIPCLRKDGSILWADINATCMTIAGRKCAVGFFADVTDRRAAEKALWESARRWDATFAAINDAVMIMDTDGRFLQCNVAAGELAGESPDQLVGRRCCEVMHNAPEFVENCPLARMRETRRREREDMPVGDRWFSVAVDPMFDGRHQLVGAVHVMHDITERKRAEQALRESEVKYSTLVGRAKDAVIVVQDEVVKFCNAACADATGYSLEELSGMPFQRIVAPESQDIVLERYQARMTGKEVPATYEIVVVRKDGAKREVELSAARIQYEGRPATMSIARDITERKQAEEQLKKAKLAAEAASRAKSEFLAVMSHEIRTPIAAIGGYADLLLSGDFPAAERREGLETIRSNVDILSRLVDDILDLSRIEAGRLPLAPADCSPHEIVEEVRGAMRLRAGEKRLDFRVVYDGPIPRTIRTDAARLRQILLNLVGNALKFTEAGSVRVTVRCPRSEDSPARLEFEVADTGIGMTAEALGRLFQPFTQADMSNTRRFGGTGLGLSIAQRLARMLGGEIEVQSELGKGSTFTLTLDPGPLEGVPMVEGDSPISADSAAEIGTVPCPLPPKGDSPISADFAAEIGTVPRAAEIGTVPRPTPQRPKLAGRVLLAEDSESVQRLIRRFLGQCGLEVDVAPDGRVACEKAAASGREGRPYDLILMDIRMPEMDGHEATRQLRQDGWRGAIVALTAHAMPGDREECLRAGCDDYLTKPSRLSDLIDVVQRYVKRSTPEPGDCPDFRGADREDGTVPFRHAPERVRTPEGFPLDIDADPELAELFRAFTAELPERADRIRAALETPDFVDVRHHAHQLKGAAAMYGFTAISRLAARIVQKAVEQAPADELRATVAELTALCQQAAARRRADGG
jgi:PAS domain S-box-containing protein